MTRAILFLLILFFAAHVGPGQDSHVQITYDKATDRTVVRSDFLYVINTPSQFMEIQLVGRYRGPGKPSQPPDKLYIEFSSFSADPIYQEDARHHLRVKADNQIIDFGLLSYARLDEKGKAEKSRTNPKPLRSNFDFGAALPSAAVISASKRSQPLTLELMSVTDLTPSNLKALADAAEVVMRLGQDVFRLTPMQQRILREFADSVSPKNTDPAAATANTRAEPVEVASGVPSEQNKASLAETLSWLKTHLEHDSGTNDIPVPRRIEPMRLKSCQISYRVVPLIRTSPVSATLVYVIFEYQIDLADLNPEAIRVSEGPGYASLTMITRDYQAKIKVYKHANDGGIMGRTLEDGLSESAVIKLKTKPAALEFKTALAHAINLCQAKP